jgi:YfiH family protein
MIQSKLLSNLGITHGYATRDEQWEKSKDIVIAQQIHGKKIAMVQDHDAGKILPGFDGLVSKKLPLGVTFADCVPILAVDPKAKIIGTAHAGWKGTFAGIASELITVMEANGADKKNISVSIGPHIGMSCYNIKEDRAEMFQKKFGNNGKITTKINGEWHLDIGYANYQLLLTAGIPEHHMELSDMCTSCQNNIFHSFRKDPKGTFGVQLAFITL